MKNPITLATYREIYPALTVEPAADGAFRVYVKPETQAGFDLFGLSDFFVSSHSGPFYFVQPREIPPASFPYPRTLAEIPAGIKLVERVAQYSSQAERFLYQCPDSCWREHCEAWERARAEARKAGHSIDVCPEPFPFGHIVFMRSAGDYRPVSHHERQARPALFSLSSG